MAKVGTEKYSIGGRTEEGYEYSVFYTKKTGFYCALPKSIQELVPDNKGIAGNSYDDAVKNIKTFIDKIYQEGFKCEKVILYYIKLGADTAEYSTKTSKGDSCIRVNNSFYTMRNNDREPGNMLYFDYHIRYMITVAGKKYINKYEAKNIEDIKHASMWHWSTYGGYGESQWMEWQYMLHTEDLEKWFKSTLINLQKLLSKIHDFFGKDTKDLLKSITESTQLLIDKPAENIK